MSPSDAEARRPRVLAIVPAAGLSRRMGRPKQLLDVHGRPMLTAVVDSLHVAGMRDVVVVTRSEVAAAIAGVLPPATRIVLNDDPATEMIHSIRLGLDAWTARTPLVPQDGILVIPGDQPGIPPACIEGCVTCFLSYPASIVIAARHSRQGHPLIFPADLIEFVQSPRCDAGLRELPRAFADRVRTVECDSEAVVRDVDTPAEYEDLRQSGAGVERLREDGPEGEGRTM